MTNRAVFFDRDDTLNIDPGYLSDPLKVVLFPGVKEYLRKLQSEYNFYIVIVSNQSGIDRKIMTEKELNAVNGRIDALLSDAGVKLNLIKYCPHHPKFSPDNLCDCRKPSPKMLLDAAKELNLDLKRSYMVGDKKSDIECGINAGTKTVLIKSKGEEIINMLKNDRKTPNFVAVNFSEACDYIIGDFSEEIA